MLFRKLVTFCHYFQTNAFTGL